MPFTEMVVSISVGLFFLLAFVFFLRMIQAWLLHRTLRAAIDRDSVHAGMLVDRIGRNDLGGIRADLGTDDRTGLILLALGAALAGFSLIVGEVDWVRYGLGAALFPALVGAALLIRHRMQSRSAEPDDAAGA
ncbi:MAG TPA: hypothetical protein VFQ67_10830 [Allosphingosinicella sp.]|jgi:hypothetical protein|nr:hypothetical protein [Allosphingosinicella sp.]